MQRVQEVAMFVAAVVALLAFAAPEGTPLLLLRLILSSLPLVSIPQRLLYMFVPPSLCIMCSFCAASLLFLALYLTTSSSRPEPTRMDTQIHTVGYNYVTLALKPNKLIGMIWRPSDTVNTLQSKDSAFYVQQETCLT